MPVYSKRFNAKNTSKWWLFYNRNIYQILEKLAELAK
jgi:hypothetical protein